MSKISIGAIGMGARLSLLLSDMLRRHSDTVELRAISDDAGEAIEYAKKLFPDTLKAYPDYRQILEDPEIDWVLIGSKNFLHRDHCVDAFAAGKHVFCEKPLGISVQECDDIRKAHLNSGNLFATGFVLRYAPLYVRMHELVNDGGVGQVISIEANENLTPDHGGYIMRSWRRFRSQSGPHLLEKCSHDLDLIYWMVGSVPRRVASFGGLDVFKKENRYLVEKLSQAHDEPPLYQAWTAWEKVDPFDCDKDIEDNQVAIIEYRNGVRATFHTNACSAFAQRRMLICGLEGTIEANLSTGQFRFTRVGRNVVDEIYNFGGADLHGGADPLIVDDLIRCMKTGEHPRASGEEGFISAITCLGIDEAMQTGQVIDLQQHWQRFGV